MEAITRNALAILGAFTVIGLLKGIITIKDDILVIVDAIQSVTRPVWSFLLSWTPFQPPNLLLDYLTMGFVTAGMRLRTTLFMWKAVQNNIWSEIILDLPFTTKRISARRSDHRKFYFLILPARLIFVLFTWPRRLGESAYQYLAGRWKRNFDGEPWATPEMEKVSKDQYRVFFETLTWTFVLIVANYALFFT